MNMRHRSEGCEHDEVHSTRSDITEKRFRLTMHTGSECLIIGAPKHGHLDFTYGLTQAGREALMLCDSCVMKLFDVFIGVLDEDEGLEKSCRGRKGV